MEVQTYSGVGVYVDGNGYLATAEQVTQPAIEERTEEFQAGGMPTPKDISLGKNKMEKEYIFLGIPKELFSAYGISNGRQVAFTDRIATMDTNGETSEVIFESQGMIKSFKVDAIKQATVVKVTFIVSLDSHKMTIDGDEMFYINNDAYIDRVNGVDRLEETRRILGIS